MPHVNMPAVKPFGWIKIDSRCIDSDSDPDPLGTFILNGRSIYGDDMRGNVGWLFLPVSFSEIKQVEALNGRAGTIYGFNAFGGIVNTSQQIQMR